MTSFATGLPRDFARRTSKAVSEQESISSRKPFAANTKARVAPRSKERATNLQDGRRSSFSSFLSLFLFGFRARNAAAVTDIQEGAAPTSVLGEVPAVAGLPVEEAGPP